MTNIIDLGNVSDRSVVVTVHKSLRQFNPEVARIYSERALNPLALAEIYADVNYRELRFERLENR